MVRVEVLRTSEVRFAGCCWVSVGGVDEDSEGAGWGGWHDDG